MTTSNDVILKRIESMEAELAQLKQQLKPSTAPNAVKTTRGILKDIPVTAEEIEEAKKIWTKAIDD